MNISDAHIKDSIALESLPEFDDHELIIRFFDRATHLRGYIALHNTTAGPAIGGTRYCYYQNETEALRDALRLSRAMTYKCALAHVPYGGGKAVLIAPRSPHAAKKRKNIKYLNAYARKIELLGGHFYTGEDVGLTETDITILAHTSSYIVGRPQVGGMPAHWAARSVFESMRAALKTVYASDSFQGRSVAIKGLGNVGFDLAGMLIRAGAHIIGADINRERVQRARAKLKKIRVVSPKSVHAERADIFSPCALGGDLSQVTIPQLQVSIVCGAANNQFAAPEDGARLFRRGIVYVPDYIANGGGLINVVDELHRGGYSQQRVEKNIRRVHTTVVRLLTESKKQHRPPDHIADQIARDRFMAV